MSPSAAPAAAPTATQPSVVEPKPAGASAVLQAAADAEAVLSKRLFFIVGCQKSGTTWLQALLHGHPEICCRGETRLGTALLPRLVAAAQAHNAEQREGQVGALSNPQVGALFRLACGMVFANWPKARKAPIVGEKTPEHALVVGLLADALPNARFVHIIRDGRDCCVSGQAHNLRQDPAGFQTKFPTPERYAAYFAEQHWARYIHTVRAFAAREPDRALEVRYEDLHADPAPQCARLLRFLGASDAPGAVDACLSAGAFETLSGGRARGQADDASHFRKGVVGDWRSAMDGASVAAFERLAGPLLRSLGYA